MPQNSDKIQHIDASTPMRRIMSASSLSSDSVRNRMGEDIGSIKEIMIDVSPPAKSPMPFCLSAASSE